jgi:hypothetical protein
MFIGGEKSMPRARKGKRPRIFTGHQHPRFLCWSQEQKEGLGKDGKVLGTVCCHRMSKRRRRPISTARSFELQRLFLENKSRPRCLWPPRFPSAFISQGLLHYRHSPSLFRKKTKYRQLSPPCSRFYRAPRLGPSRNPSPTPELRFRSHGG